ncbi:DUF262 domain-containing protein [Serratia sp. CY54039]|uniref:DUF262 domain-containing protein n=1 Tax=Serratia TaxID=613 RepID=UPI0038C6D100
MTIEKEKIEKKFSKSQNSLVLQQADLSLSSISDMVNNNAIDISPKYQRRERWDDDKESSLIESFLLNIPVPPIYLAEDEYGVYSVIDGKQRVTAINKFLNNELKLKNLEKFNELEGLTFSELPPSLSNALKIRPYLRVVTLLNQSDTDLKHEVFLRLNKAGVPLNSQEIRNVAFRGDFNNALFELSENPYFNKILKASKNSTTYREMIDVQYVLRFFTIRNYWNSFPGNMDIAMDNFMLANSKMNKQDVSASKKLFNDALVFCETVWGDNAYLRPNGSKRIIQGFYDIQMVCSSLLTEQERMHALGNANAVRDALINELDNNREFTEAISQFTSNPKNLSYRISHFVNILKGI